MSHTVPADPATHPGTNRVPRDRKIKTKKETCAGSEREGFLLSKLAEEFGAGGVSCRFGTVPSHGWRGRAYRDVFTACPEPARHTPSRQQSLQHIPSQSPKKTQGKTTPSARNISVKRIKGSPIRLFGSSPINFSNSVMPSPSDLKLPAQFSGCSRST